MQQPGYVLSRAGLPAQFETNRQQRKQQGRIDRTGRRWPRTAHRLHEARPRAFRDANWSNRPAGSAVRARASGPRDTPAPGTSRAGRTNASPAVAHVQMRPGPPCGPCPIILVSWPAAEHRFVRIDRLEVSGGFLDGLRLSFSSGLTVLIGPRGAGKTSVLELLRFGLGVAAMTEEAESAAAQQARAVLGDGTVSVFCAVQGEPLVFSRTALDEVPTASADFNYVPPLIVSQNEIEAIGLNPGSRREILDSLLDPVARSELLDENDGRARIATVQARLERLRLERTGLLDQGSQVEALAASLAEAEVEQRTSSDLAAKVGPLQKRVADAADELGRLRAATDAYQAAERILAEWNSAVESATLGRPLPDLPSGAAESDIAAAIARAQDNLRAAATEISAAISLASG